jgi:hypothetical protein
MKALLLLFGVAGGFLLAGCESDIAPGTEIPQKFERGIRGQGELYETDRSPVPGSPGYDPSIREESRVGD